MKKFAFGLLLLTGGFLCWGTLATATESRTLTGEYVWNRDGTRGALEAVFTPADDGHWEVVFYANFNDRRVTYEGTARGSLSDGGLQGEVKSESRRQTYRFKGTFKGGSFAGTHSEVRRGSDRPLGTLTLGH